MKKHGLVSKMLSTLLVLAMMPVGALASDKGTIHAVPTGINGNINTEDTISLPIRILDYESDGMLFEFANSNAEKTPWDFGATYVCDYTTDFYSANYVAEGTADDAAPSATNTAVWKSNASSASRFILGGTDQQYLRLRNGGGYQTIAEFTNLNLDGGPHIVADTTQHGNWWSGPNFIKADAARYMVIVYRYPATNAYNSATLTFTANCYSAWEYGDTQFQDATAALFRGGSESITIARSNQWESKVIDLGGTAIYRSDLNRDGEFGRILMNSPQLDANNEIHFAYIAFFDNETAANKFAEYGVTRGSDNGDNLAYGFLRGNRYENVIPTKNDPYSAYSYPSVSNYLLESDGAVHTWLASQYSVDAPWYGYFEYIKNLSILYDLDFSASGISNKIGYRLVGNILTDSTMATLGLLQGSLNEDGNPEYKEQVVGYLAGLLQNTLAIPEYNDATGWKNYRYIGSDVAWSIRTKITGKQKGQTYAASEFTLGSYAATVAKKNSLLNKTITQADIKTCYDAAYYLLNNIFIADTYNEPQTYYNYLVLSAGTDSTTGKKTYVFDGGFTSAANANATSSIEYNKENKTIQNTNANAKAGYQYTDKDQETTNLYPFTPVTAKNNAAGQTKTPYYQDDGTRINTAGTGDSIVNRNFSFAMVSEGEFVYHAEDELFWEFEGDDDVYLFINGQLVMDMGAAHSVSSIRFNLNDYVKLARAGQLGNAERNAALALEEGGVYDFKFYYMERHSYGSNIRIATNIRVTDPEMTTEKLAWQNDKQLAYGSAVASGVPVEYGFSITNTGGGKLSNFTFADNDIGVTLSYQTGYSKNTAAYGLLDNGVNLTAIIINADGTEHSRGTITTSDILKKFLDETVLTSGQTLMIRGIQYTIDQSVGVFNNTVFTSAVGETTTGNEILYGQASMRVYLPGDPIYYQWAEHELVIPQNQWLQDIFDSGVTARELTEWWLTDSDGNVQEYSFVSWVGDGETELRINYYEPGIKMFYVSIGFRGVNGLVTVPFFVNVADVEDSTIVLDYGLPVSISATELTKNDAVDIFGSDNTWSIIGFGDGKGYANNEISFDLNTNQKKHSGTYGDFVITDNIITYTPDTFLKGVEEIDIAVNVYNKNTTPNNLGDDLDINNEVEMYKTIRIVPANVMYYEDDFAGITYTIAEGEKLSLKNVKTDMFEEYDKLTVTDRSEDLTQSDDQEMNYGYDPLYAAATNEEISGGSMHKILLDSTEDFSFTFQGTGFELIGRTNAKDTGTIIAKEEDGTAGVSETGETYNMPAEAQLEVEVVTTYPAAESAYSMSGETMFTSRKIYPVIMEFDNGNDGGDDEICQVPVLRIDGLDYGTHTVTVTGVQAYEWDGSTRGDPIPTYFYFDGLRIYQPLGDDDTHYNKYEKDAKFEEIRDLIIDGEAAVASYDESLEISKIGTGNHVITWTENLNEDYEKTDDAVKDEVEINTVDSVDDYLIKGPNNEVYMLDNETSGVDSGIFFFVKEPSPETKVGTPSLQVAVRAIDFGKFIGTGSTQTKVRVQYNAMNANGNYAWTDLVPAKEIVTGTELYYDIDYTKCPKDENSGTYMVALRVYSDAAANNYMASYTSLKLTGGLSIATEWEYNSDGFVYDSGSNNETTYSAEYTTSENLYNTVAYAMVEQLKSDIIITSSDAGSTPEIDDPFQNLPETNEPETDDDNTNDGEEESSKPSNFDLLKLFTLTAIAGEGGTITPEGDLIIAFGASRTFKFIPDEGYEIADVLVNGKSVGAVEKYVLKAAHADTVVEVLFREIPEAAADAEAAAEEAAG